VILDREKAAARIRQISTQFGLKVDPAARVEDLPVGIQQRVEIIKVLYRQAEILILDEPTAVLTPQEVDELFKVIESLIAQGKSLIFISHKLNEVLTISDRIMVLRNGRLVGSTTPAEATENSLASMMVGREVILDLEKQEVEPGEIILKVEDLSVLDDRHLQAVDGVSFDIRAGEVLGIAGVQGNGQTELIEALTGLRPIQSGQVAVFGRIAPALRHGSSGSWGRLMSRKIASGMGWFYLSRWRIIWCLTPITSLHSPKALTWTRRRSIKQPPSE
jgi:general nucleoside transport system ATP-binding protein